MERLGAEARFASNFEFLGKLVGALIENEFRMVSIRGVCKVELAEVRF